MYPNLIIFISAPLMALIQCDVSPYVSFFFIFYEFGIF